jgi:hypothetical protein
MLEGAEAQYYFFVGPAKSEVFSAQLVTVFSDAELRWAQKTIKRKSNHCIKSNTGTST